MAYIQRVGRHGLARHEVVEDRAYPDQNYPDVVERDHEINVISRVIWLAAGVMMLLLGFRFLLSLLGANITSGFAQFIYNTSYPFVAPFFNLFSYNNIQYGVSRFEIYTLIAMLVYLAIAWVLSAAVNISRR